MEDSLDIAMRKEIPAWDSELLKRAIEEGTDLTTKRVMKRGNLISLVTLRDELKSWDISDSESDRISSYKPVKEERN